MKTLNITLDDDEYAAVLAVKQRWGVSWHDFIIQAATGHKKNG